LEVAEYVNKVQGSSVYFWPAQPHLYHHKAFLAHLRYTPLAMAEALGLYTGIVASIGTLIQLSEIVVEYIRITAGANDEKKAMLLEITETNILLKELEGKAQALEWKKTLESVQKADGPLERYRSALTEVEDKLQPSKNRFAKVTKRFVWYFQKEEFTEILAKISRSKMDFSTLLNL
jgi:hypothetical protein